MALDRNRFVLAATATILLGAALSIAGRPVWALTAAHVLTAVILAVFTLRHRPHGAWLITVAAVLWASAQGLRLTSASASSAMLLMAPAMVLMALGLGASVRRIPALIRRDRAWLDLISVSLALIAVQWLSLRTRESSWAQVLVMIVVAIAIALMIASSAPVAGLGLMGIGGFTWVHGLGMTGPTWDLLGAVGVVVLLISLNLRTAPTSRSWLSSAMVALGLLAGVATLTGDQVRGIEIAIVVILVVLLVLREVIALGHVRLLKAEIASQVQVLRHQALHDPLTQLANRDLFHDRLEHALSLRTRAFAPLSVLHIDVDNFTEVNDRYGHATGDVLLVAFADRLTAWVRPTDTVARLGGDEFAIIVDGTEDAAMVVADRIRTEIARGFEHSGRTIPLTINIGVATLERVDGEVSETLSRLLNEADRAMHRSKRDPQHNVALVRVD